MNNITNDLLWVWIIFTALLFSPLKENGELKITQNEENNLKMLMEEIGDINKLKENKDGKPEEEQSRGHDSLRDGGKDKRGGL